MVYLVSTLGIILSIIGGTAFLVSRYRPGIEWDNPGWITGMIYSYSTFPWVFMAFFFLEFNKDQFPATSLLGQLFLGCALLFIVITLLMRKFSAEDKNYTSIGEGKHGSLRHSRLCTFFYVLSLVIITIISVAIFSLI